MKDAHHNRRGVNVAVVTQQTQRDGHKNSGLGECSSRQHTDRHTSVSALQPRPRPSVTLSPYERQIVRAISGGPERLQSCSGAMEEVAAHRQALLAASRTHNHSPPLTRFILLSVWEVSISPSKLDVASCRASLAFTLSVLNAPVSTTSISYSFVTITEIPTSIL